MAPYLHCASDAQGAQACKGLTVKASELDLPSLTRLCVAGWGRLVLVIARWDTSVAQLQVVELTTQAVVVVSPLGNKILDLFSAQ